ncbi:MAG: ABC transporter ATP-binding protein [bacterium]
MKRYKGFTLGPIDFELEPGVTLGLIGPNGAGKTTTINILAGLIRHDAGTVKIFGRKNNPNDAKWKFDLGFVGDTHVFYEYWSGRKNLDFIRQFYPTWNDEYAVKLAEKFSLDLKKRANTLSKGNRVKLSLIQTLAHRPKLLLLDEPASGLDPIVRNEFLETLWDLPDASETAILYSTHNLAEISRIADELAFLREGKLIERTAKDDLVNHWRKISFRYEGELQSIDHVEEHRVEVKDHLVISSDYEATTKQLDEKGVENIELSPLTLEEIAIFIMKRSGITEKHSR